MSHLLLHLIWGASSLLSSPGDTFHVARATAAGFSPTGQIWIAGEKELFTFRSDTLFAQNSFSSFGPLQSADFSNPLKVLLFFQSTGQIMLLDNTATMLAEPVDLNMMGLEQAIAACISYDNGIWLFIGDQMRLVRLNENLQITLSVPNAGRLAGFPDFHPRRMMEKHNLLWLLDPDAGVVIFDVFGGFVHAWNIPGIREIGSWGNSMFGIHHSGEIFAFGSTSLPVVKTGYVEDCDNCLALATGMMLCSTGQFVIRKSIIP